VKDAEPPVLVATKISVGARLELGMIERHGVKAASSSYSAGADISSHHSASSSYSFGIDPGFYRQIFRHLTTAGIVVDSNTVLVQ
jgi:hypothetical protein